MTGLLLTLGVGLCTLLGSMIVFLTKNNTKFIRYGMSVSLGVIISLVVLELIPESYELISEKANLFMTIIIIVLSAFVGIFILKVLDGFIPNHGHSNKHDHHGKPKKENCNHSYLHLAVVTSIALVVHNIFEGMAVFSVASNSLKAGLPISIGIALHNIPLGTTITSFFYKANSSKLKTILLITLISLSTFLGGLILFIFDNITFTPIAEGIILGITLGMLIYIMIFELIPHLKEDKNKTKHIIGIAIGIIIFLISMTLE